MATKTTLYLAVKREGREWEEGREGSRSVWKEVAKNGGGRGKGKGRER